MPMFLYYDPEDPEAADIAWRFALILVRNGLAPGYEGVLVLPAVRREVP